MKSIFSGMALYTGADWWRYAGFVLLNVALATGGTYCITASLPPIRDEALHSFVLPMGLISLAIFLVLYPVLRRLTPGIPRFLALYGAFNVALFTLALLFIVGGLLSNPGSDDLIRSSVVLLGLIVGCGHMYGFVPLLGIAAVNKVFSRLFFPRLAAAC